jgi:ribosomal 50S subunit-recycling heat shock protein
MRLDKFLKVSRIIKRRTIAQQAADSGRVSVNDRIVKPGYQLKVGDVITIEFGESLLKVKVTGLKETVRKEEADLLYEVIESTAKLKNS